MQFTLAQYQTLKTWLTSGGGAGLGDIDAMNLANAAATGPYFIWNSAASKAAVDAAITKANYTPADTVPAGSATDLTQPLIFQNRALVAQLKQTNAMWMTTGQGSINAQTLNVRQILSDCLGSIPCGASGANLNAGWNAGANPGAVRLALMRPATNCEKLYVVAVASGPGNDGIAGNRGTNTNPDVPGIGADGNNLEGLVTQEQIAEARNS